MKTRSLVFSTLFFAVVNNQAFGSVDCSMKASLIKSDWASSTASIYLSASETYEVYEGKDSVTIPFSKQYNNVMDFGINTTTQYLSEDRKTTTEVKRNFTYQAFAEQDGELFRLALHQFGKGFASRSSGAIRTVDFDSGIPLMFEHNLNDNVKVVLTCQKDKK